MSGPAAPSPAARPLLAVRELFAGYGDSMVLHGVALQIGAGELVALFGRNGCGRSTLAKALVGQLPARGSVRFRGRELIGLPPHRIARRGIGYVPEQREVFASLSVEQNLLLGLQPARWRRREEGGESVEGEARAEGSMGEAAPAGWSLDALYTLFAPLAARRRVPAGALSGGEQQMLALARSLAGNPRLLLLDEPTEGLAPQVVELVGRCLHELRSRGVAVLLVEQKLGFALGIADRCLVRGHGRIVFDGAPQLLREADALRREWLEV